VLHGHGETRTALCLYRGGVHTCERTCQPSSYAYLVGRPPSVSCVGARLWPGFFEIRKKILGRGHKKEILKNIQSG
jgi:hypothetical protein